MILGAYKEQFPPIPSGFIFRGERRGFALNLESLAHRERSHRLLNGGWRGWHAFRRGLGTRLSNGLKVDAKTVQLILRHANVSTTLAYYIIPEPKKAAAAMAKLNRALKAIQ